MFNKIVYVDKTGLVNKAQLAMSNLSKKSIIEVTSDASSEEETVERIGDADCALVSWRTPITKSVIEKCPNLKYIGMCCSLIDENSSNVDVSFARSKGIEVKGVRDYGDEGVIEYIFSEIIKLAKGLNGQLWKDEPIEITGRTIGIIGMGATGIMLAKAAMAFNMKVLYFSRTRKPEIETPNIQYVALPTLLKKCEILSTHLPRNTQILGKEEFAQLGNGKIFINTSLGFTFDLNALNNWIQHKNNFALFDGDNHKLLKGKQLHKNILSTPIVSGWTKEAKERLSHKVIENIQTYFTSRKTHQ